MFAAVFVLSLIVALILKKWLWLRIEHWARKAPNSWRDRVVHELDLPAKMLAFGLTVSFAQNFVPDNFHHEQLINLTLRIYFIFVGVVILNRAAKIMIAGDHGYFGKLNVGSRQLILIIVRVVIYLIGGLIILDGLGISITPLLASLGVGSVAVALALQDTLSNFFSGIYVLADRPINIGDYVRLDDGAGMEGYVVQIGWRSTRIQQLSGNVVVVPNSKIASSRLINYNLPTPETSFSVNVGISYEADLEKVEKVSLEVAKKVVSQSAGSPPSYNPSISFNSFGDSAINMSVNLRAQKFVDSFQLKHELIKALHSRFKAEGIEIPHPQLLQQRSCCGNTSKT